MRCTNFQKLNIQPSPHASQKMNSIQKSRSLLSSNSVSFIFNIFIFSPWWQINFLAFTFLIHRSTYLSVSRRERPRSLTLTRPHRCANTRANCSSAPRSRSSHVAHSTILVFYFRFIFRLLPRFSVCPRIAQRSFFWIFLGLSLVIPPRGTLRSAPGVVCLPFFFIFHSFFISALRPRLRLEILSVSISPRLRSFIFLPPPPSCAPFVLSTVPSLPLPVRRQLRDRHYPTAYLRVKTSGGAVGGGMRRGERASA